MAGAGFKDYPPEVAVRKRIVESAEEQQIKAARGCLDTSFLAGDHDPWVLATTDPDAVAHRDAVLADGWLGVRISPAGDASAYTDGSRSYCYGLRDRTDGTEAGRIRELPVFATWQVDEVKHRHGRPQQQVSDFRQELDLRRACLCTHRRITAVSGTIDVDHTVYLPQQYHGVVVLEMQLRRVAGSWWRVSEVLSTAGIADATDVAMAEDADGDLVLTARLDGHRIAIVSRLIGDVTTEVQGDGRSAMIELTDQLTTTKVVAIAGDELDDDPVAAAKARVTAVAADLAEARRAHEACWEQRWQAGITVGNTGLQTVLNASLFQLLSSTRTDVPAGIPPCGLSGANWKGSVFWDLDSWMQPPLDYLHPDLGASLCAFRVNGLAGAKARATERGYAGADYPWQATPTGMPLNTAEVGELQRHITAGVVRSLWQHYLVTGDQEWLRSVWPVFAETAAYWLSRATPYEQGMTIAGVRQPDEYAPVGQCHAMTNASAAWSLRQTAHVAELLGESVDPGWIDLADELVILRDPASGRILQWEGWHDERVIKQADVGLLVHPWGVLSDPDELRDLLDYYGSRYDSYLIMMAVAIDAIIACRIGEAERAWAIVEQLLEWYRPPYLQTSESPWNECMNFLTGLGGFLQVFLNGFAGIQMQEDALVLQPCLPTALPDLRIGRLTVAGVAMDLHIQEGAVLVQGGKPGLPVTVRWADGTSSSAVLGSHTTRIAR